LHCKKLKQWGELVATGKKTPEQVLATINSKYQLTDEQTQAILGLNAEKPKQQAKQQEPARAPVEEQTNEEWTRDYELASEGDNQE